MRIGIGIGISRARRAGSKGPVNTVAPEVTGTAERGEELSCSTGTWTGTGTITYAYQWYRSGALIIGATNSTYTLVGADDNAQMSCAVTATDDEGSRVAFSNAVGPVLGAPLNLTAPVLSGTEAVGEELSVTDGTWQGQATITFAYQWRRDGSNISGATSSTYTLVADDYDTVIDCVVTATNSLDSASADSNDTGAIAGLAPTNDTAPSISGSDGLGDTLTRTAGSWSGTPTPSVSGQWRRNGVAIPSETGATYTIVAADSGADIDYIETATNAEGSATADSNDITTQTFTAPTNDVAPSITGNDPATIDDVLTRVEGTWSGNPTPVLTGEWYRNNVATGETGSTYTVTAADDNSFIFYRETATNAIGSASADSAAVTVEDFTVPAITGVPTIAGTEEVGETLTATAAAVTGNPTPVRTWQWQRSADGSTGWADISGATSSTYVLDAADEANYVRVKQIETNALGSDEAASAATGEIQAGGATGILDSYLGAAFAAALDVLLYSSHSVTDNAVGSATNGQTGQYTVRVRRSSDNAVSSFTYTEVSDGTLTTWVGAGNDGFVEAWYEQGTNGNHATQGTAANQPKIVDAGNLVVENGKAAMEFDGSNDILQNSNLGSVFSGNYGSSKSLTSFGVQTFDLSGGDIIGIGLGSSTSNTPIFTFNRKNTTNIVSFVRDDSNQSANNNATLQNQQYLITTTVDNSNLTTYVDNVLGDSDSHNLSNCTFDNFSVGGLVRSSAGFHFSGLISLSTLFPVDQSTNRTAIETAINNEYNIY